jgi:trigger factor
MQHDHAHDVEVKKVDRLSPTEVRLTIAFSGAQVAQHEKKMAERYTRDAAIPGFRPGKAPMKMVMEKYRDRIRQDVVSHLLEAGLSEALEQTKLMPINRPRIEMGKISFEVEAPLEFHAQFEIEPEVQVKAYKGVPLKKLDNVVSDEEVEKTLETLRERLAVMEPSESTKPAKGSFAVVEVAYKLKDDASKGEPSSSFTVELGNDKLIPEIDAAFMSMSVGEERKVEGTFPADYHEKELASKTAVFDCKIIELKTRTLPEVNDQFAETVRPGTTLLSLKSDIRTNIEGTKTQQARRAQRQEIIDYLVSKNGFDVPKTMIENQSRKLLENMAQDLKSRGQALPPLKEDEMAAVRSSAEEIVRGGMLLKRIAIQENIEISEDKLMGRVSELAKQWNQKPEETRKFLEDQGVLDRVRDEVLTDQIFDFLVENAKSA